MGPDLDVGMPAKRAAGAVEHLRLEVETHARRARPLGEHERERGAVTGAEIEHALDTLGTTSSIAAYPSVRCGIL